jgi:hypothetical protein
MAIRDELSKLADTCEEAASRCQRVVARISLPPPGAEDIYSRIRTACRIWKTPQELSLELGVSELIVNEYLQYLVRIQVLEIRSHQYRVIP